MRVHACARMHPVFYYYYYDCIYFLLGTGFPSSPPSGKLGTGKLSTMCSCRVSAYTLIALRYS